MSLILHRINYVLFIAVSLQASVLLACEVPVFSYAMQYWTAEPYRVYIFHQGILSQSETHVIEQFKSVATHGTLETNMQVEVFDLDILDDAAMLELYRNHLHGASPSVLVLYPVSSRVHVPVYAGPLTDTLISELVDSPARRSVIRNLVAGNVAVWVLVESGDHGADTAAAEMLEKELRRMEQVLQLPDIDLWAWSDTLRESAIDNKGIRFSIVRVARDTPEEVFFIRMLLNSEPDLIERGDAPIAFPIYGRGLVLYALVGAGINEWTIGEACDFMVGPCSCEAKASNPGTDLLLAVNWSQHLRKTHYDQVVPLAGFSDFFERGEVLASQLAEKDDTTRIESDTSLSATIDAAESHPRFGIVVFVVVLCSVTGIFLGVSYLQLIHKEKD